MDKWFVTDDNSDKSLTIICSFYHVLLSNVNPLRPDMSINLQSTFVPSSMGHFHFKQSLRCIPVSHHGPTTLSSLSNLALLSTDNIIHIRLKIVLKYQLLQKMIVNMCQYQKVLKIFQLIFAGFFCPGLKYW